MSVNVFYYSRYSKLCVDLLKMMQNYKIIDRFVLKCVEDMVQLPPSLERVPTIVLADVKRILVGNEVVKWFDDNRQYLIQQSEEINAKKMLYNITQNSCNVGPKGYSSSELGGISDDFAYVDIDEAQPKTFVSYGDDGNIIYTPPKDGKINDSVQNKLVADIENNRKMQEIEYSKNMRHEQINKIINSEYDQLMKNRMGL